MLREFASFKLLVRAVGMLLIGTSIPNFSFGLLNLWGMWYQSGSLFERSYTAIHYLMGPTCQAGFGAWLLFGANRVIHRCIREVRDHCLSCGYNIKGLTTGRCPECGEVFESRHAEAPPPPVDPPVKIDP